MPMKILLLGKDGQIGWELQRSLSIFGDVISLGHAEADFENLDNLRRLVRQSQPKVIVNAAAYTAVDKAETEFQKAFLVNAKAVEVLCEETRKLNSWLVHYSTDYVFDGTKNEAYLETDHPNPLNVYGKSKFTGEKAIQDSECRHFIFRSSWIYSLRGGNFPLAILRRAQYLEQFDVVADCLGAPTSASLVSHVTAMVLYRIMIDPKKWQESSGIYHLSADGSTSWYDYAQFIISLALKRGFPIKAVPNRIFPVSIEKLINLASRPKNSRLSTKKLCNHFGLVMPDWRIHVEKFIEELSIAKPL